MKKPILLFLLNFLFLTQLFPQKFGWIESIGSHSIDAAEDIVVVDEHIYLTGIYSDTLDIGDTTLLCNLGGNSHSWQFNVFLAKYDTSGNFYWAKSLGGNQSCEVSSMVINNQGYLFLGGHFTDSATFGNFTLSEKPGYTSNFILKVDTSGVVVWANSIQSHTYAIRNVQLASTQSDVYFLRGAFIDSVFYKNTLIGIGQGEHFLIKINSQGNFEWLNKIQYSLLRNYNNNYSIASNENNSIYIGGMYENTIQIGSHSVTSTGGNPDIFLTSIDSSGAVNWLKTTADSTNTILGTLEVDQSGNLYLAGENPFNLNSLILDTLSLSGGVLYLIKLDSSGNVLFGKSYGGTTTGGPFIMDMSCGLNNSMYLTGRFDNNLPLQGYGTLTSNGTIDLFVLKFDSTGTLQWGQSAGGGSSDISNSLANDNNGNVYSAGYYTGLSKFGTREINTKGGFTGIDAYLMKLSDCNGYSANITAIGDTILCSSSAVVRLKSPHALGYEFQWLDNGIEIPGEEFPNLFPTDSGAYSVIVNNNGCIDTSNVINVRFDSVPQANLNLTAFDTICKNSAPFPLSGGSPSGGTWIGQAVVNGNFDPAMSDTGKVKITYFFSNGNCSDSASQYIYVAANPAASISGTKVVCANSSGFSYSTTSPGSTFNWNVTGGTIASGQFSPTVAINWGAAGQGIITLNETNSYGCQSSIQDTIQIIDPIINTTISGPDTVCASATGNVYSVAASSVLYQWKVVGGIITSGNNTSTISVDWNNATQGTLSVKLINSCFSDTTFYDTVLIQPSPNPMITGPLTVCANSEPATYSTIGVGPNFDWSVIGGTIISGQNSDTIKVKWNSTGIGQVKLIESNSHGCSDSTSTTVNLLTPITNNLIKNICETSTYNFNGKKLTSTGIYYDTLSSSIGCDSITILNLTVDLLPNDSMIQQQDTLIAFASGLNYQWYTCDTSNNSLAPISGATSRRYKVTNNGFYSLAVSNSSCSDTSNCKYIILVGFKDFDENTQLKIFPNPTNDIISIQGQLKSNEVAHIEIRSFTGQIVIKESIENSLGRIDKNYSLSKFAKGIYLLGIQVGDRKISKKIILL